MKDAFLHPDASYSLLGHFKSVPPQRRRQVPLYYKVQSNYHESIKCEINWNICRVDDVINFLFTVILVNTFMNLRFTHKMEILDISVLSSWITVFNCELTFPNQPLQEKNQEVCPENYEENSGRGAVFFLINLTDTTRRWLMFERRDPYCHPYHMQLGRSTGRWTSLMRHT